MKKQKKLKSRDWVVVMMLIHTKPNTHGDAKRKKSKSKCRKKVDTFKEGW